MSYHDSNKRVFVNELSTGNEINCKKKKKSCIQRKSLLREKTFKCHFYHPVSFIKMLVRDFKKDFEERKNERTYLRRKLQHACIKQTRGRTLSLTHIPHRDIIKIINIKYSWMYIYTYVCTRVCVCVRVRLCCFYRTDAWQTVVTKTRKSLGVSRL